MKITAEAGKSLADRIYDALLDRVLLRDLAPGTTLHERRLAAEMGVSRTPVREAMGRLEAEGLVSRRPHQLPAVREITVAEFLEALHVRQRLETEAAALAAPEFPLEGVRRLRERVARPVDTAAPTPGEPWGTDDDFHERVAAASGNGLLREIIAGLRRRTRMFNLKRMPDRFPPGCREHPAVLDALEARDAPAVRAATAAHLGNVRRSLLVELRQFFQ